jgi:hypothetical protein
MRLHLHRTAFPGTARHIVPMYFREGRCVAVQVFVKIRGRFGQNIAQPQNPTESAIFYNPAICFDRLNTPPSGLNCVRRVIHSQITQNKKRKSAKSV